MVRVCIRVIIKDVEVRDKVKVKITIRVIVKAYHCRWTSCCRRFLRGILCSGGGVVSRKVQSLPGQGLTT